MRNYGFLDLEHFRITSFSFSFFYFLLFSFPSAYSQSPDFEKYTTKSGLITDEVYNLQQDRKGYLWIFSRYGTVKFNGSRFTRVLKNLPFKESFVYAIFENEMGQKWIANSNARIFEVRNDSAFLIKGIEDISATLRSRVNEIFKLFVDDSLNIYVITKGYSYKLLRTGRGYQPVNLSKSLNADSIMYCVKDLGKDVIVIANREMIDGLTYINKIKTKFYIQLKREGSDQLLLNPFYHLNVLNPSTHIRNLKRYGKNYHFLFSNLFCTIDDQNVLSYVKLGTPALNFSGDKYGHFWVGCLNDGVYEIDENGKILNHYLQDLTINDVLIDHQNGLWASTPGSGLFYCENMKNVSYKKQESLGTPINLIKILDDQLYIANNKGEIYINAGNEFKKIRAADGQAIIEVIKQDDKLVISNISKTQVVRQGKQSDVKSIAGLDPICLKMLFKSKDTLIGCTRKSIVYAVKSEWKKVFYCDKKLFNIGLYNNILWIGTDDGVYQLPVEFKLESKLYNDVIIYDTIALSQPGYLKGTRNSEIGKIVEDRATNLWFCSKGDGLFRLEGKKLRNYSTLNGLPDNIVNDFFIGNNNQVLLATNSGLYVSRLNVLKGEFERWEKIYTGAVAVSAIYRDKIYIGTTEGLTILNNNEMGSRSEKYFFNLISVIVDGKEINPESFWGVSSGKRNLEFDFDLINFRMDKIPIRYYLSGSASDSGLIENTDLRLGQLPHGKYTLKAFPDSHQKSAMVVVPFLVEPALWQTRGFQAIVFLMALLIITVTLWLIIRYNRKKALARTRNEQLILEYKLIALKAQINPHFMSNCLSAVQELIVNGNNNKAAFYIAQFGLLVRKILDFSSRQLITLGEELDLLRIYIDLEQLRFANKFIFKINIEKGISLKETYVPSLILNPIVENAIWHGLLPSQTRKQGLLNIDIKTGDNALMISIEDNGVGRVSEKEPNNGKSQSLGIKITEQRLNNINFLYTHSDSRIMYTDLIDSDNRSAGTRATIYLPVDLMPAHNGQN